MREKHPATLLAAALILCFAFGTVQGQDVPRITKDELKAKLGSPDLVLLDVRIGGDWKASELKLPGAIRPDLEKPAKEWAAGLPKDKEIVLYCA
jgi:rhodanese-related sulfurtransferase